MLLLPEKTLLAILIEGRMDSENTFFYGESRGLSNLCNSKSISSI